MFFNANEFNAFIKTEEFKDMLIHLEMLMLEEVSMICKEFLGEEIGSKGLSNK
jgi:hypothetical protein